MVLVQNLSLTFVGPFRSYTALSYLYFSRCGWSRDRARAVQLLIL